MYGELGSSAPVTPVEMLEKMAPTPYPRAEYYRPPSPPPRRRNPPQIEPFSMNDVMPASTAPVNHLQELRQIKYILIGVAILLFLLLILRR